MEDTGVRKLLDVVKRHLRPAGRFYATVIEGRNRNLGVWLGLPIYARRLRTYIPWFASAGLTCVNTGRVPRLANELMVEARHRG
jgi:hypothetical protein